MANEQTPPVVPAEIEYMSAISLVLGYAVHPEIFPLFCEWMAEEAAKAGRKWEPAGRETEKMKEHMTMAQEWVDEKIIDYVRRRRRNEA